MELSEVRSGSSVEVVVSCYVAFAAIFLFRHRRMLLAGETLGTNVTLRDLGICHSPCGFSKGPQRLFISEVVGWYGIAS